MSGPAAHRQDAGAMAFYGDVFGWEFTDYSGVAGSPY